MGQPAALAKKGVARESCDRGKPRTLDTVHPLLDPKRVPNRVPKRANMTSCDRVELHESPANSQVTDPLKASHNPKWRDQGVTTETRMMVGRSLLDEMMTSS